MKPTYPHISRTGSTVTIEARTMAEADAAAEAELGPGFSVTSVRRLRKGGFGGFFAAVLVEMVATAPGATPPAGAPEMATAEDLLQGLQRHEGDFAARLLDRIGDIDPDTMTLQQLMAAGRAGGLPIEAWDDVPWDMRPADSTHDGSTLATVPDAPSYAGTDRSATNELPAVADSIGPDPLGIDGPPLDRRQPRSTAEPGPLDEMPPRPLRFDEDSGRWTVEPPGSMPVDDVAPVPLDGQPVVPPPPELILAIAPEAPAAPSAPPPAPAAWSAPALPAPRLVVPTVLPLPAAAPAPAPTPIIQATTPTFEAEAPNAGPAATLGPATIEPASLAQAGWIIDLDTPEPVLGGAVLGPWLPTDDAPVVEPIDALTALPELAGPVVNASAPEPAMPHVPDAAPTGIAVEPVASDDIADADADAEIEPAASIDIDIDVGIETDIDVGIETDVAPADRLDEAPERARTAAPAAEPDSDASWAATAAQLGTGLDSLRARTRPTVAWRSRPLPIEHTDEPVVPPVEAAQAEAPAPAPEPSASPAADAEPIVVATPPPDAVALPGTVAAFAAPALGPDRPATDPFVGPHVSFQPVANVRTFQALLPEVELAVAPDGTGDGWSARALQALGLPDRLVQVASGLAPRDDAEWTAALVLALRPLFGKLPEGRALLAGPAVAAVAEQLGARRVAAGAVADEALVVLETEDPAEVAATLDGRRFHLVVGGMWHELARLQPAVVSAAGPRFLLPAVAVAHAWGVPLGVIAAPTVARLDAVTVAMDIRATLGLDGDRPATADRYLSWP